MKTARATMLIWLPKDPKGAWQVVGPRKCVSVSVLYESASCAYCFHRCHCSSANNLQPRTIKLHENETEMGPMQMRNGKV